MLNSLFFYFFSVLAVCSALLMVTRRNLAHAAICFVATLLATAGIFLQLHAEFLFIVQVLLGAGGIAVLFVFATKLVNRDDLVRPGQLERRRLVGAGMVAVLAAEILFAIFVGRASLRLPAMQVDISPRNTEVVGDALFHQFIVPFEIASVLLLVAMIGGVVMAKKGT